MKLRWFILLSTQKPSVALRSLQTIDHLVLTTNQSLVISNVYRAINRVEKRTLFFIFNVDKPDVTIIDGPRQFAVVGKSKKLICKYDALPPVSKAQWIKDGDVIARNSSLLVNESRFSVQYYNESQIQLLINQSTSQDAGNYTCLIINSVGNSSQKTSVISQGIVCYKALYNYACLFFLAVGNSNWWNSMSHIYCKRSHEVLEGLL